MPAQVIITEPARNVVEIHSTTNSVTVIEQVNTVTVNALTRAVGNATISGAIDVTNTIGDALAGGTYSAGTTLETIVRDLISPFFEPTFAAISWSATGAAQSDGESLLIECGLQPTISAVNITWSNPENVDPATDVTVTDLTVQPNQTFTFNINALTTNDMPYSAQLNYTPAALTVPATRSFVISAAYLGNDGNSAAVSFSKNVYAYYRHRMYVISSPASTISGVSALLNSAVSTPLSTLSLVPTGSNTITVNCDSGTANTSNYTWILIPSSATLSEVTAEVGGVGVADYTESFIVSNNGGNFYSYIVGTASPTYKVYRSNQTGAFDSDVTLKLTITH